MHVFCLEAALCKEIVQKKEFENDVWCSENNIKLKRAVERIRTGRILTVKLLYFSVSFISDFLFISVL